MKSTIFKSYIPIISHLKLIDSMISLKEIATLKLQISSLSPFPSVKLYQDIFDSLDREDIEQLEYLAEDEEEIICKVELIEEEQSEDIKIINPSFFAAAINILIFI
ncbi:MAG: hypothetical protein ACQEWI_12430 [Bacillota bacterium]